LLLLRPPAKWYTAFVNITYVDPATSELRTEKTECGPLRGALAEARRQGDGALPVAPLDRQACDPNGRFAVPARAGAWVALVAGGNCTYEDKIRHATAQNASAVVVFNVGSSVVNETITMAHPGTGEVVAIMIPEPKGREVAALLERNVAVTMTITIGTRNLQKYVSRTSVVFVSISFIVLMIISLAWVVFYYIQRFRYANARDRNQVSAGRHFCRLCPEGFTHNSYKLQVRTIRKGDQETEADFDNCAVCIEGYKANDVVRILPCRHLFHKSCVDPWLLDPRTCSIVARGTSSEPIGIACEVHPERRLPGRPAAGLRPAAGRCRGSGRSRGPGARGQRRHAERGWLLRGAGSRRAAGGTPSGLPGPRHPEGQPVDGHHRHTHR
uniref:RING-type domain-containing protein n=1 Tax=Gasterosteus aculeatus aculeatus TaxID=481459 RepID=G3Q3X6_GASAC